MPPSILDGSVPSEFSHAHKILIITEMMHLQICHRSSLKAQHTITIQPRTPNLDDNGDDAPPNFPLLITSPESIIILSEPANMFYVHDTMPSSCCSKAIHSDPADTMHHTIHPERANISPCVLVASLETSQFTL